MNNIFKKDKLITAFDIEGDIIKLAQVRVRDNIPALYRILIEKSKSQNPEDLTKSISKLAARYKLSDSLVLINLPRHMVTVRDMKMPAVKPEELEGMIALQSAKLLPYPKEEIVYSYKVLGTTPDGYSRVMLY